MFNQNDFQIQLQRSKSQQTQGNLSNNPKIKIQQIDNTIYHLKQTGSTQNVNQQKVPFKQQAIVPQNYQIQQNYALKNQKQLQKEQFQQQQITQNRFCIDQSKSQQEHKIASDDYIEEEGKPLDIKRSISEIRQNQQKNSNYQQLENQKNKAEQNILKTNFNNYYLKQQNTNIQSKVKPQTSNQEEISPNITDSQLIQWQSEIKVNLNQCYYCKTFIQETYIQLSCFHLFHIICLKEFIKNQIQIYKEVQQICCLCKKKITKIPFIEVSINEKWQLEIVKKQEELIYLKYKNHLKKCQNNKCNFFWIIDKFSSDKQCVQCTK